MEITREVHRLKNVTEPIPEMRREIGHHTMSIIEKCAEKDFLRLEAIVADDYTPLKHFT